MVQKEDCHAIGTGRGLPVQKYRRKVTSCTVVQGEDYYCRTRTLAGGGTGRELLVGTDEDCHGTECMLP